MAIMGRMNTRYIQLTERGEYEEGRADWEASRYNSVHTGEARIAYELGRCSAQMDVLLRSEPHAA